MLQIMETTWERESRQNETRVKQKAARWVGVILIVAGLLFFVALSNYQFRLIVFGTTATGQIVDFEATPKGWGKPVVHVTLANGETIEFRGASMKGDGLSVGDIVPVYYIRNEPVFGEVATFRQFWLGVIVIGGLAIASLAGGFMILRVWSGWFGRS